MKKLLFGSAEKPEVQELKLRRIALKVNYVTKAVLIAVYTIVDGSVLADSEFLFLPFFLMLCAIKFDSIYKNKLYMYIDVHINTVTCKKITLCGYQPGFQK